MLRRFTLILMTLCLVGFGGAIRAQDDTAQNINFYLTFVPNVQFSPMYVALDGGHFAERGLDVTTEYIDEPVLVDLIAAGEVQFGMVSGEQVLMARAGGRPVVYVYEWFQKYPVGIVVPDTVAAETVDELRGLRVGIPGRFGANYSGLIALLAANDMDERDIQLEPIGYVAPDVLCAGQIDVSVIYVNNEPLQIQQRADLGQCDDVTEVRVLRVADEANMVSNGVVTSEALIESDPDLVRAALAAFDDGLRQTIQNPALAYLVSLDYVENLPISDDLRDALQEAATEQARFLEEEQPDREAIAASRETLLESLAAEFEPELLLQFRVLLATIELWDGDRLGANNAEGWQLTLDVLEMMGGLPGAVDLTDAYTDDYLPALPDSAGD